jgi:hypothetical protein
MALIVFLTWQLSDLHLCGFGKKLIDNLIKVRDLFSALMLSRTTW